jgi:FixJ family two-component response regulator
MSLKAGADDHITKPLQAKVLLEVVNRALTEAPFA